MSAEEDRARQEHDAAFTALENAVAQAEACAVALEALTDGLWCGAIVEASRRLRFEAQWYRDQQEKRRAEEAERG